MSDTASLISEAHLEITATLQPGDSIDLGAAFPGGTQADLTFTYVDSTTAGASYEGAVIPEPATMSLLGLGALALIRRRR
ncbi:MAG: PEP-CTERM sorting domain-containing protein [Planctomycetes bacterium]|nr:PEP-CTERM sorting domain-containing protein [Planctomycetota bacterium]